MIDPKPPITIIQACEDPEIFGPWFRDRETWAAWFAFLRVMFGLQLSDAELAVFKKFTGREAPAAMGYLDATLVIGRRGGKSLIMAVIAAYLACFFDWSPFLTGGERAVIVIVSADRRQSAVLLRYLKGMLDIPLLAGLVDRETLDTIELKNLVTIEIQTASWKTIRGRTVAAALCDEVAFWADDTSANPDTEIINALKPAMATIPKAMMIKASSPYARRGTLWNDYRKHFGKDESSLLVWQAATRDMNPSVAQTFIDAAYADDPSAAAAEYGGTFRTDIENFISREAVDACVISGRYELPPVEGITYAGFLDAAGGSGQDAMGMAISHREGDRAVLDAIRVVEPPFSPEEVARDFAKVLKSYRIKKVFGDRWAGLWPRERLEAYGVGYDASVKVKSDIYRDFLPLINGGRVELLDHPKMIAQLCSLERRTARGGKDSIDHPPGNHHDDIINCVAGTLTSQIILEWDEGRTYWELFQREKREWKATSTDALGHPPGAPEPITREWAVGSIEHSKFLAGEIGPPT